MSTPLATVAQLAATLQVTLDPADAAAILQLATASGKIRDFLQQDITATAGDVVELDPLDGAYVILPQLPVTAVSLVEMFVTDPVTGILTWTTADPTTYTVSKRLGMIAAKPGYGVNWPTDPETWRVTYDHGFTVVPDSLQGVCAAIAARAYASPAGVDLERIGGYQAKYSKDDFSPTEISTLTKYGRVGIA
jgi:hypothetical protein